MEFYAFMFVMKGLMLMVTELHIENVREMGLGLVLFVKEVELCNTVSHEYTNYAYSTITCSA